MRAQRKILKLQEHGRLVLSDTLQIPPDLLVSNGNGIFGAGAQGSGKSVTLKLLLEQLAQKALIPMAIFDKEEDLTETVKLFPRGIVGTNRSCPTARDIYQHGLQVVFNLSTWPNLDTAGQMIARMVKDLMDEAESTPQHKRVPVVVGMDEASYWLPQQRGDSLSKETYWYLKSAFEAVAARGRKRGLVPFLFTQKFSHIHKDVLSPGTYILMKQVVHTEQERYLDYIQPIGEFAYFTVRQKRMRIGDLHTGEAIVLFANGEQQIVQFHHCQSPHKAVTPTTHAARERYGSRSFDPGSLHFEAYCESPKSDEPESLEQLPPLSVPTPKKASTKARPKHAPTIRERVFALLSEQPELTSRQLSALIGCPQNTAQIARRAYFSQVPKIGVQESRITALLAEKSDYTVSQLARRARCSSADVRKILARIEARRASSLELPARQ